MRKITLIFLICAFFAAPSQAEITLVNENNSHDIEVTYQFCKITFPEGMTDCTGLKTSTVKANINNHIHKIANYPNMESIIIVSAIEKDFSGKIIAQGTYGTGNGFSACGLSYYEDNISNNVVISLSDLRNTSIIRCLANRY